MEPFTLDEQALLAPFVTNLDQPIFGLRNLPEVVKGALFSRYSRSDKSLRRLLLDEFIAAPESGFQAIVATPGDTSQQLVATKQAEAFYERVLIGYGDDSVAELGGAHVACEGVSNIAAKLLEDSRLGIDPLEKSTRYVPFNKKDDGRYRYLRPAEIMASPFATRYEATLDALFDTYDALLAPTLEWVRQQHPRDATTSERAYNSATRAKALDLLRGLLPMATLTNVGLFGNGRAFEYLLTKLYASEFAEARDLATALQHELDLLIPSFVKRAKTERGAAQQRYLRETRATVGALVAELLPIQANEPSPLVRLVDYDPLAEEKTLANILFAYSDASLEACRARAAELEADECVRLLRAYVGERGVRFHKPGRAFEEPYYTFELLADIGAYRDLQRHRILTQERQRYTPRHGYDVPPELVDAGLARRYQASLDATAELFATIERELPHAAQYVVPFAYRVRWRIKLNLREAFHLIELRSAPQGHPTYRRIAQELFGAIRAVHPTLAEGMRFVDLGATGLERLEAERRLDAKIAAREQGS